MIDLGGRQVRILLHRFFPRFQGALEIAGLEQRQGVAHFLLLCRRRRQRKTLFSQNRLRRRLGRRQHDTDAKQPGHNDCERKYSFHDEQSLFRRQKNTLEQQSILAYGPKRRRSSPHGRNCLATPMHGAGRPSLALFGRQIVRVVGLAGQLVEKSAGKRRPGLAPLAPAERHGERQPPLGPRDTHVTQSPLFVHRRLPHRPPSDGAATGLLPCRPCTPPKTPAPWRHGASSGPRRSAPASNPCPGRTRRPPARPLAGSRRGSVSPPAGRSSPRR